MSPPQISRTTLAAASAIIVFVGFVGGVLASYDGGDGASGDVPSDVATATGSSTSTSPPTTAAPTSAPRVTVPRTSASTAARSTTALPATPPTAGGATAALEVHYSRDSTGHMRVPRSGSSVVVVRNIGGSLGTFTVQAVGWVTADSSGQVVGTLAPGENRTVSIRAAPKAPASDAVGTVTVYDAAGLVVAIPAAVV